MTSEILNILRSKDHILTAITEDRQFRVVFLKAGDLVRTAIEKHTLNPLGGIILGELLMGAALLSSSLKGQERLALRITCSGPIQQALVEASANGEIRGYLSNANPIAEGATKQEIIQNAIGVGIMHVTRVLTETAKPQTSSTELPYSQVAKDLAHFCVTSDQIPTAIQLSIDYSSTGTLDHAAGLLIQAMPGATEENIAKIESTMARHPDLGKLFFESENIQEAMKSFLADFQFIELDKTKVDFFCRCSKDRFMQGLAMLPEKDLSEMATEENQTLNCHWCSEKYTVSQSEILDLLEKK